MAYLKSALKSALLPIRKAGGRFFVNQENSIIWKAAEILSAELVEGDYLEFGVFQGRSMINAFKTIRDVYRQRSNLEIHSPEYRRQVAELWKKMRFFAFDSFRGLPKPKDADCHSSDFTEGKFACDMPAFYKNLRFSDVDVSKVFAVPGWFEETCVESTIKTHDMKAASIIHVDCDLYIQPLMVDGTVLIFDDWYCFRGNPDLGEQRAFREWAESRQDWRFTEYQKEGPWRMSFIANRASGPLTDAEIVKASPRMGDAA